MKRLLVAVATLATAWSATPAGAYVVEVTTSVTLSDAENRGELKSALQTAVEDVIHQAIAFTPTLIVLTHAALVGDRLYVRLLLADQDGERAFEDLAPHDDDPTDGGRAPDTSAELRI